MIKIITLLIIVMIIISYGAFPDTFRSKRQSSVLLLGCHEEWLRVRKEKRSLE